jgi:two-component system cell cycle sensor histidine kinase/response regulator CckA
MTELENDRGIQVLLVEDDPHVQDHIRKLVELLNESSEFGVALEMESVGTGRDCVNHLLEYIVDVVLLDLSLPDVQGVAAIAQVTQQFPFVPIIVLTNTSGWASMVQCAEAGGRDYLLKTELEPDMLLRSICYAYERKQVEDRLRQSQEVYQSLVEHLPVGVFRKDTRGRYLYVNQAFCEATGYKKEQIGRKNDSDLFVSEDAANLMTDERQLFESNEKHEKNYKLKTLNGRNFEAQIVRIPVIGIDDEICEVQGLLCDVTERNKLEEQCRFADRFAGMSTLAGGIAHHINNRLVPIMLNATHIESQIDDPRLKNAMENIRKEALKAGQVVRHLLAMTQDTDGKMMPVELDLVFSDLDRHVAASFSRDYSVEVRLPPNLRDVKGDFTQLKDLLEQVCENGCEAMESSGVVTITAVNTTQEFFIADGSDGSVPVDAVLVQINDDGRGIPRDIRNRVFDPYFTTKERESHEGLGLSRCMRIAQNHDGILRIGIPSGKGTCIELILPAMEVGDLSENVNLNLQSNSAKGKTILVVDDGESIVELMETILEEIGCKVLTASNGAEAISIFSHHASEIDLVITDFKMPYMDGAELSKAIREISRTIPIFVATGLDSRDTVKKLEGLGIREIISKPYDPKKLVDKISLELEKRDGPRISGQ